MATPCLIVGLGNPGLQYLRQRHNVGFRVVDAFNRRMSVDPSSTREGDVAKGMIHEQEVITLKPKTFMNLSGQAVQPLMGFYKIPLDHVYVVHDDLDLVFGEIRFKRGGGDGGHNGLRSITACVGAEYARVRLGIGRPADPRIDIASYVLSNFSPEEQKLIDALAERLAQKGEILWSAPQPQAFLKTLSLTTP